MNDCPSQFILGFITLLLLVQSTIILLATAYAALVVSHPRTMAYIRCRLKAMLFDKKCDICAGAPLLQPMNETDADSGKGSIVELDI